MSAVLMAAIDGIQRRLDPGRPLDKDLYDLAPDELKDVLKTPSSLEESLAALRKIRPSVGGCPTRIPHPP